MLPDQLPVIETAPTIASYNSVYASDNCVEEDHPLSLKGEALHAASGWEDGEDEDGEAR